MRFSDRFSREVRAVVALNHPNICQIYDVGPNYLVMELLERATERKTMTTINAETDDNGARCATGSGCRAREAGCEEGR